MLEKHLHLAICSSPPQTAIVIAYPGLVTRVRRSAELWITVLVEVVCMVFFVR